VSAIVPAEPSPERVLIKFCRNPVDWLPLLKVRWFEALGAGVDLIQGHVARSIIRSAQGRFQFAHRFRPDRFIAIVEDRSSVSKDADQVLGKWVASFGERRSESVIGWTLSGTEEKSFDRGFVHDSLKPSRVCDAVRQVG
jgi:hypothetical protein